MIRRAELRKEGGLRVLWQYLSRSTGDSDGDGIPDVIEQGPTEGLVDFDGNDDGEPDRTPANVVSTHSRGEVGYLTFELPKGDVFEAFRARFAPGNTTEDGMRFPLDAFSFRALVEERDVELRTSIHYAPPFDYEGYHRYGDIRSSADPGWEAIVTEVDSSARLRTFVARIRDGAAADNDSIENGSLDVTLALGRAEETAPEVESDGGGGCRMALGASRSGAFGALGLLVAMVARVGRRRRTR